MVFNGEGRLVSFKGDIVIIIYSSNELSFEVMQDICIK